MEATEESEDFQIQGTEVILKHALVFFSPCNGHFASHSLLCFMFSSFSFKETYVAPFVSIPLMIKHGRNMSVHTEAYGRLE